MPTLATVAPTVLTVVPTVFTVVPTVLTVASMVLKVVPTVFTVALTVLTVAPTVLTVVPTVFTVVPTVFAVVPTVLTVVPTVFAVALTVLTVALTVYTIMPTENAYMAGPRQPMAAVGTMVPTIFTSAETVNRIINTKTIIMKKIRCSIAYHKLRLGQITTFAGGTRDGIYTNAATFVTPPMVEADYQLLITNYQLTRDLYKQGGLAQKGPFLAAKDALMEGMDTMAAYVDTVALGDANIITLAGFVPTKGTASEAPAPEQVTGVLVTHGSTGQLLAECDKQDAATSYGCIMTPHQPLPPDISISEQGQLILAESGTPTPIPPPEGTGATGGTTGTVMGIIDLNTNRKKKFTGLTPGVTYYFAFYAINASGVGALSLPASLMCV